MIDDKTRCRAAVGIGMPEFRTELIDPSNRQQDRPRHHELVIQATVRSGCVVGTSVNATTDIGWTGDLTEVLIREFEILGTECDGTHLEVRVNGEVEAFQIAIDNRQPWISFISEGDIQDISAID